MPEARDGWSTGSSCPELKCVTYKGAQDNWMPLCVLPSVLKGTLSLSLLWGWCFSQLGFQIGCLLSPLCAPDVATATPERAGLSARSSEQLVVALNPFPAGLHTPSCPPEDGSIMWAPVTSEFNVTHLSISLQVCDVTKILLR